MEPAVPVQSFEMSSAEDFQGNESSENEQLISYLQPTPVLPEKNDKSRENFFSTVFQSPRRVLSPRCVLSEANRPISPCLNSFLRTASPVSLQMGGNRKTEALDKQLEMWKERAQVWARQKRLLEKKLDTLLKAPVSKVVEMRMKVFEHKIEDLQRQLTNAKKRGVQEATQTLKEHLEANLTQCKSELELAKGKLAENETVLRKQNQLLKEREMRVNIIEAEVTHLKQLRTEEEKLHGLKTTALQHRCAALEEAEDRVMKQFEALHAQVLARDKEMQAADSKSGKKRTAFSDTVREMEEEHTKVLSSLQEEIKCVLFREKRDSTLALMTKCSKFESELVKAREDVSDLKSKLALSEMKVRELENEVQKKGIFPKKRTVSTINYKELCTALAANEELARSVMGKGLAKLTEHYESVLVLKEKVHKEELGRLKEGLSGMDFTVNSI